MLTLARVAPLLRSTLTEEGYLRETDLMAADKHVLAHHIAIRKGHRPLVLSLPGPKENLDHLNIQAILLTYPTFLKIPTTQCGLVT